MSRKVINVVSKGSSDNILYFNRTSEVSGEDLTQEQVENLIGMSLSQFIANCERYRNPVIINNINSEERKTVIYNVGYNTNFVLEEINGIITFYCTFYFQGDPEGPISFFIFTVAFNKETKEYISGAFIEQFFPTE